MTKQTITPGIYKHYKGTFYEALHVATHSESGEKVVVYRSIEDNKIYVRPLEMWDEIVNGVPRFEALKKRSKR